MDWKVGAEHLLFFPIRNQIWSIKAPSTLHFCLHIVLLHTGFSFEKHEHFAVRVALRKLTFFQKNHYLYQIDSLSFFIWKNVRRHLTKMLFSWTLCVTNLTEEFGCVEFAYFRTRGRGFHCFLFRLLKGRLRQLSHAHLILLQRQELWQIRSLNIWFKKKV